MNHPRLPKLTRKVCVVRIFVIRCAYLH